MQPPKFFCKYSQGDLNVNFVPQMLSLKYFVLCGQNSKLQETSAKQWTLTFLTYASYQIDEFLKYHVISGFIFNYFSNCMSVKFACILTNSHKIVICDDRLCENLTSMHGLVLVSLSDII